MAEVVGKAPVTRKHRRVLWNAYTPPPAPSAPSTLPTLPPLPGTPPASSPANPSMSQPPQPSLRPHGCASLLLRPTGIPVLPEEVIYCILPFCAPKVIGREIQPTSCVLQPFPHPLFSIPSDSAVYFPTALPRIGLRLPRPARHLLGLCCATATM